MKKRILVLLPVLPQKSYFQSIAQSLFFLTDDYQLDFIDPFDIHAMVERSTYYQCCRDWLQNRVLQYDAFFGFSFGGVILQQCFSLFEQLNKTIVLFSTPTFANADLKKKLKRVITLCEAMQVQEALNTLDKYVFTENNQAVTHFEITSEKDAAARMIWGLQKVLDTDSQSVVEQSKVTYCHLIGEHSQLVNRRNVIAPKKGTLVVVPKAGMRVLQDNVAFCKQIIEESLGSDPFKLNRVWPF